MIFNLIHSSQGFIKRYKCGSQHEADREARFHEMKNNQPRYSVKAVPVQKGDYKIITTGTLVGFTVLVYDVYTADCLGERFVSVGSYNEETETDHWGIISDDDVFYYTDGEIPTAGYPLCDGYQVDKIVKAWIIEVGSYE